MRQAHQPSMSAHAPRLSDTDVKDVEDHVSIRAPIIYEVVRREGDEEMNRPATSLMWSGAAAGLSLSFSLLAQAVLQIHVPEGQAKPLLTCLGYCVGFQIVVLARQQLFTENTITAVLPLAAHPTMRNLRRVARLWGLVLLANVGGTLFSALFCTFTPAISPEIRAAMLELSRHAMEYNVVELFFRAITAGYLMAVMVWLIPSAEAAKFFVIALMTYLIAIGGFAHVVAGSFEAFMLVLDGQMQPLAMLLEFFIPVLIGNIIGGTALFAFISYAQVAKEM